MMIAYDLRELLPIMLSMKVVFYFSLDIRGVFHPTLSSQETFHTMLGI